MKKLILTASLLFSINSLSCDDIQQGKTAEYRIRGIAKRMGATSYRLGIGAGGDSQSMTYTGLFQVPGSNPENSFDSDIYIVTVEVSSTTCASTNESYGVVGAEKPIP